MTTEQDSYINLGIQISELVKPTLGPKGLNQMVVGKTTVLTNDGATIIGALKIDNPLGEVFKGLAKSQEEAAGDGTTSTMVVVSALLQYSLDLLNKGIHKTTIIQGYDIAKKACLQYLMQHSLQPDKLSLIKTSFGSKISRDYVDKLSELILKVKNLNRFKMFPKGNSNPKNSILLNGYMFVGDTINDRMPNKASGKIAVLDLKSNLQLDKFNITDVDQLDAVSNRDSDYKREIVDKLVENGVKAVFYSDTNPELESYLTEKGLMGVVTFKRDDIDEICRATGAQAVSSIKQFHEEMLGEGNVEYKKPSQITVTSKDAKVQTLVLCGSTTQVLDETKRAVEDVVGLLQHDLMMVYGGGNIEVKLANHVREVAKKIGGKEQIVIERFADALEEIPLTLSRNCGHDAIETLGNLRTLVSTDSPNAGIDPIMKVSDVAERGVVEPTSMKMHMINSATDVANLIIKIDKILPSQDE